MQDAEQPGTNIAFSTPQVQATPRPLESILDQVVGALNVPRQATRVATQMRNAADDEIGGAAIAQSHAEAPDPHSITFRCVRLRDLPGAAAMRRHSRPRPCGAGASRLPPATGDVGGETAA